MNDQHLIVPALILPGVLFLAGCGSGQSSQKAPANGDSAIETLDTPAAVPDTIVMAPLPDGSGPTFDAVNKRIGDVGTLPFTSHNGRQVNDGFTLTLLPKGAARVEYRGAEADTRDGRYSIDPQNLLYLDFGPDDPWLPMPIVIDGDTFVINAPDKEAIIEAVVDSGLQRSDITDEDIRMLYDAWPLKISDNTP